MARGATKVEVPGGAADDGDGPKASKRRCVQSACVPCRKRKSKCDGSTPVCATCTAVYKTDCYYDEASETRRAKSTTTAAKRENSSSAGPSSTTGDSDNAEFLVKSIRTLPEVDVYDLIQHIRKDPRLDIAGLADSWRKNVTLPYHTTSDNASLEGDLGLLLGKPSLGGGETRHYGHTSGLGLVPEDENYTGSGISAMMRPGQDQYKNGTWTSVTQDMGFVERLLDLYFQWSHPFYVIFSRECFYRDFHSGRQKYCSPLLVNAILSYACHFTDERAGRTDPDNFRTAGDHFFAEARRLLYENETPSLTTTQALCVMAMREPSAGRDSSGFMYIGRCVRMAIELGLHLNTSDASSLNLTPSEVEVRKVTFWGCFTVDTVWSLCIGRISQLPRAAITLDKPILEESTSGTFAAHQLAPGPVTSRLFLQHFSTLSELINDNNFMYYAPKERFTSRRLLDQYQKYKNWYANLPPALHLPERPDLKPLPHIAVLHMLYWTVILHLFRPMLKVDLMNSDVRPRDICIEAANNVTDLLRLYRSHYNLRACQLVLTHILLSVSVVHLLYSQTSQASEANLVESLKGLEDMSVCHYFGARSFKIVHSLAQTWDLPWPEQLKLSKLVPQDENSKITTPSAAPVGSVFDTRSTPEAAKHVASRSIQNGYNNDHMTAGMGERRESLSMFAQNRNASLGGMGSPNAIMSPDPTQQPLPQQATSLPFSNAASHPVPASSQDEHAETLFWSMPGVGVPVLHRNYQMSPMDLNNMLGSANEWERFGRDGFKMSEAWPAQDMQGYGNATGAGDAAMNLGVGGASGYGAVSGQGVPVHDQNSGSGYEHWWGGSNPGNV